MTVSENLKWQILLVLTLLPFVSCECNENMTWMRHYDFGDVIIKWNFTDTDLTMFMLGKTTGWVALGFSTNKSLIGADVVVGWVTVKDNNKIYLQDRYGSQDNKTLLDDKSNYESLGGAEVGNYTYLCWTRKLDTCDKQDFTFDFSTVHVFAAIGVKNTTDANLDVPPNLGSNTVNKSLRFLNLEYPKPNTPDIMSVNFTARNAPIAADPSGTVYWCTHFTLPKSNKPSHMVSAEPIIQKENAHLVHHYLMYECPRGLMESVLSLSIPSKGYSCFDYLKFPFQDECLKLISTWAVGGSIVNFPPDIGYPFHSTEENKYYMIQTHYNVGSLKSQIKDNSGVRFYYTYNLRKFATQTVVFGIHISPFQLIPPGQKEFSNFGYCDSLCTKPTIGEDGIQIKAVMFHAHLAARKLSLRIIRDGKEVYNLADNNYDFDYQPLTFLAKEMKIMPGDELISECVYDTTSRNTTTVGGFATKQEMCLIFLMYTPTIDLTWCISYLKPPEVLKLAGNATIAPLPNLCFGTKCPYVYGQQGTAILLGKILLPVKDMGRKLVDYLEHYPWTSSDIKTLKDMYLKDQIPLCKIDTSNFNSSITDVAYRPSFKPLETVTCTESEKR